MNRRALLLLVCWSLCWLPTLASAGGDARAATEGLLKRLLPAYTRQFVFEVIPRDAAGDVFEIESRDGKAVIRGNNGVAMAMGLNWFLKHHCHCHVSWYGDQLNLPQPLPRVEPKVRRVSWAKHRYFLNYCCLGYSRPWWDWKQWERLIDWMALNGVNMPLAVTGQEAVWQAVCRRLGMSDAQITEFLAGPPYLPFQWMGCLDGFGGPLPKKWIPQHEELEKKILARERELGMTPVLQGFTGHVPAAVAQLFPKAPLQRIKWIEWETHLLDPLDPLFAKIAKMFLEEQTRRFGTDHLYAADTFIEMVPPNGDLKYLANLSRAIYDGMAASDPQAVWVLQGWAFMFSKKFWEQPRIKAFLDAIPNERMIVLDLYCESTPMWDKTDAFCGKPWLWCNVQSFGRTVGLGAALTRNNDGLFAARRDPKSGSLVGLGFVNEGLCYNPVAYDLMFENAWRDEAVDSKTWLAGYARHRYGKDNAAAQRAWQTLLDTVLNTPTRSVSAVTTAPALTRGRWMTPYDDARLAEAWRDLLQAADELGRTDTFRFDLVNVARQVLTDHASKLHGDMAKAWRAKDVAALEKESQRFLDLIGDLDELLATRQEFLLGGWLEAAKRWGATPAERAKCEWNARRVLTLWGETFAINDYARRQWSGMLSGYYAPRWKRFLDAAAASLRENKPLDSKQYNAELLKWTAQWSDRRESFPTKPRGDSIAVARKLWTKYSDGFKPEPITQDAVSLTTGKPATCSNALSQYPARLANDGMRSDTDRYWATDVQRDPAAWWQVDLEKPTIVGRVVVVCFFGDNRHYGFTVEVSNDAQHWEKVVDRRNNKEPSTDEGYTCTFASRPVRYIRVTQTHNSANTGRHLVEVMAFER
ncbi:MAG: alpha-N-acetylglucosaminidase C-terminal domain-containing protein [Verrucomicrobia bacterium]|nr:alpha-N-acetylglucosaminidase C-terminal domain-containing protein [Verrucomicrobiota bacterium]